MKEISGNIKNILKNFQVVRNLKNCKTIRVRFFIYFPETKNNIRVKF